MNYFEFKKILDADPYSKDPEFLQAKNDDIRCKRAFKEAMANEQIIIDALNIPVPRHDIAHIKFNQTQIKQNSIRNNYFAAAASLLLLFGAGVFFITNTQNSDLEKFINDALMMEPAVYMSDAEIPQDKLAP